MLFVVVDKKKVKTEVGITLRICLDTHLLKEKSFFGIQLSLAPKRMTPKENKSS
jgi:hypothetical protein